MRQESNIFYAKILLFGEYTVIFNSKALTVPFGHFSGEISYINKNRYTDYDFAKQSNMDLKKFGDFLKDIDHKNELGFQFDFTRFEKDLERGMFFESNIPMGYGLGSSGSLCAGLYHEYAIDKIPNDSSIAEEDVLQLKGHFERMESFFHGKSSGLDPLNCYFGSPMLLEGNNIRFITIPKSPIHSTGAIFLINTGRSSKTQPLVELFMQKTKERDFHEKLHSKFIPLANNSIDSLLSGDSDIFFSNLRELSELQYNYFSPMIPDAFMNIWKQGFETNRFYLKLCGSGGGGYLLGFTRNFEEIQSFMKSYEIVPIRVYREE